MSTRNLEYAMYSACIFGGGLLGGLGATSAGKASASYKTMDVLTDKQGKDEATALYFGYLFSTLLYFGAMISFIVLLTISVYKRP